MNHPWIVLLALTALLAGCGGTESPATPTSKAEHAEEGTGHDEDGGHEEEGHGEEGHEEGHVKLTAAQIEASGIQLVQAGPAQIRETLPLYGLIAPNAERVREVSARFPGAIRSVAKKVGDAVREGESLAGVEANESLQTYAVAAPLSGIVIARNANPGEQTGDKVLFTVADLSTVWVELSLFPRDAAKIAVGQSVLVRNEQAEQSAEGKVVYLAPFGQSANQTLTARVLLDNPDRRWAPGLNVTAEVTLAQTDVALAIRRDALQTLEGKDVVFVQHDGGFEPRPVTLGRKDSTTVEVLTDLTAGDTYAAAHSFILKAELGKGEAEHSH